MADDIKNYVTINEAAKQLGLSALYVRLLAKSGMIPAQAIGERSGNWSGTNTSDRRAKIWLVDPRPESRDWRTYQEAADALEIKRSQLRSRVYQAKLQFVETSDARLKVVTLASLEVLRRKKAEDTKGG